MATSDIQSFLQQRRYHARNARGLLSKQYFTILDDLKVGYPEWTVLMDRFLVDPRNGLPEVGKHRSNKRGNLGRELRDPHMTFDVFHKGLQFLRPKWVNMDLALGWESGAITFHEMVLPLYVDPLDEVAMFGEPTPTDPVHRGGIPIHRRDVDPDDAPLAPMDADWDNPKSMLAYFFKLIRFELAIGPYHWNRLIQRYLDDPRNGIRDNPVDRTNLRGSLNKDLNRATMTWEVFMKGLHFLGPQWCQLGCELCWESQVTTRHTQLVSLGGRRPTTPTPGWDQERNPIDPSYRQFIPTINLDNLMSR